MTYVCVPSGQSQGVPVNWWLLQVARVAWDTESTRQLLIRRSGKIHRHW